jgi:excinuclease UvrABC nuclease subunit
MHPSSYAVTDSVEDGSEFVGTLAHASTLFRFPGCYLLYDIKGSLLYVGQSKNVSMRLSRGHKKIPYNLVRVIAVSDKFERLAYEAHLINELRPPLNKSIRG